MIRGGVFFILTMAMVLQALGQEPSATPVKRSWFKRILHPFSSSAAPRYKNEKLRGLTVEVQISPQPVKLSEIRQLEIKAILKSAANYPITLDFPTDQRIEIHLMDSDGKILTKWSDNHAFSETPGIVTINPQEQVQYNQTIATRDLAPNRVYIAVVFFPKYPDLRAREKFLTAP